MSGGRGVTTVMTAPALVAGPTPAELDAFRPVTVREQMLHRVSRPDYSDWLHHVQAAAGCSNPIRLVGEILTVNVNQTSGAWGVSSTRSTTDMPDGAIYKPCGNRRANACPSCADTYRRDAYQIIRAGMIGGKGVSDTVAQHPAVFATFTAPSFGPVHTHVVRHHTCTNRRRCDCRPLPCRANRLEPVCPHGAPLTCFARHTVTDARLGQPLCLDCYDHGEQVVWNLTAGELWRRTCIAITRAIRRTAKAHGISPRTVKVSYGKVAETQRRGVMHFHAIIRLDGADPDNPTVVLTPPWQLGVADLVDAITHGATHTAFTTPPHPTRPGGWQIGWGAQLDIRPVTVSADGDITDSMVAAYLAKYATKSTEDTGHVSRRLTSETIDIYADESGNHTERLVNACWTLGTPKDWRNLRHWAHMLGFGGHFLTKSRRYSVTFRVLREARVIWRRTEQPPSGPPPPADETTLVVNFLEFAGAGWHTNGDALLANSAAARAREYAQVVREEMASLGY
jgi:hypothetical protein